MNSKLSILLLIFLLVGSMVVLFAEEETSSKPEFARVIETFDEGARARDWKVSGSRFTKKGFPQMRYVDVYPKSMKDQIEDEDTQRVLGVNVGFKMAGHNYLEIIPLDKGTQEESPIYLNGVVETIDMWIWGANYRYKLDVCLMDYHGIIYRLPFCSLEFIGWQHKKVRVPHYIPQLVKHIPHARPLRLVKFIVTTGYKEYFDNYYIYIDFINYMTDRYHETFDGDELIDPKKIEEIWGVAPTGTGQ